MKFMVAVNSKKVIVTDRNMVGVRDRKGSFQEDVYAAIIAGYIHEGEKPCFNTKGMKSFYIVSTDEYNLIWYVSRAILDVIWTSKDAPWQFAQFSDIEVELYSSKLSDIDQTY